MSYEHRAELFLELQHLCSLLGSINRRIQALEDIQPEKATLEAEAMMVHLRIREVSDEMKRADNG